jgi:hypothetical protein
MNAKGSFRLIGIFVLVSCALASIATLLFACIHWHNWWSLFVAAPLFVAFLVPSVCFSYNAMDDLPLNEMPMDPGTFTSCRELGWAMAGILLLFSYSVPVMLWYNSMAFPWQAALVVILGSLTSVMWAYVLWLRIFVFRV